MLEDKTITDSQEVSPKDISVRRRKILKVLGYIGVGVLSYLIFLLLLFPYHLAGDILLKRVKESVKAPLKVGKITTKLIPPKAVMEDVSIFYSESDQVPFLNVQKLSLHPKILPALLKKANLRFEAKLYGGTLSGTYRGDMKGGTLAAKFDGLKLEEYSPLSNLTKISFMGEASGKLDLTLDAKKPEQNTGSFELNIKGAHAGEIDLKITKVDLDFNKCHIAAVFNGNKITIQKGDLRGPKIGLNFKGEITLMPNLKQSRLNLHITLVPSPEFEQKIPFNFFKKISKGQYTAQLTGTPNQPLLK